MVFPDYYCPKAELSETPRKNSMNFNPSFSTIDYLRKVEGPGSMLL
jgi:hypothetical protein